MFASTRSGILRSVSFTKPLNIPDFLLPAFANSPVRSFQNTSRCSSRIGAAPLSVPPEVNLKLLTPAQSKRDTAVRRTAPSQTVEIVGPLGELDRHQTETHTNTKAKQGTLMLPIPPYMTFEQDPAVRKATLKITDREERKQREMWGVYITNIVRRYTYFEKEQLVLCSIITYLVYRKAIPQF